MKVGFAKGWNAGYGENTGGFPDLGSLASGMYLVRTFGRTVLDILKSRCLFDI